MANIPELLSKIHTELTKLRTDVQDLGRDVSPILVVNVHADQDAQKVAEDIRRELDRYGVRR